MAAISIRNSVAFLLGGLLCGALHSAQVSGQVLDASTGAPVPGALVSLQATNTRTVADSLGNFQLAGTAGQNLVLVGAKQGYFNTEVLATSPATGVTIQVEPVPQHSSPLYSFVNPSACAFCHRDQVDQWTDSPMALAGENTWVYDIYDGTGTTGGMGGFVYTRDSRFAASNLESECAACHQPEPWVEAPHSALEDINNLSTNALHGISCEVCHKVAHIDETRTNFPGIYPGVVELTRPEPGASQVEYGVLGDTSFVYPGLMRPSYQPQLTAALCAACHQDKNDPDEDGDFEEPNGVVSEPTYQEWLASPYADPDSGVAASCVDCHMPSYGATQVATFGNPPVRDPESIRSHKIEGTTAEYLDNAVELSVDGEWVANTLHVDVEVENRHTGHHVPTGVTVRNMVLLVEAWTDPGGQLLSSTGTQTVHELGGVGDPTQGDYAGLPGKLYAKLNHDPSGVGPVFFTEATGIQWDNRIPALATDATQYTFDIPPGTSTVRVRARLIYRRAFRALTKAKQWTEDGHGNPLEDVAAPHYGHLMEERGLRIEPGLLFYESDLNPAYSLTSVSGRPAIGTSLEVGLDNPLGTQAPGAKSFLFLSLEPDPAQPGGTQVPGYGMAGGGAPGELLIRLQRPYAFGFLGGPPWTGPGAPAPVSLAIPPDPGLLGMEAYAQGILIDPTYAFGARYGLTESLRLTLGP